MEHSGCEHHRKADYVVFMYALGLSIDLSIQKLDLAGTGGNRTHQGQHVPLTQF
jgi:hypothetical protein